MVDVHCHITESLVGNISKEIIYVTNGVNISDSKKAIELAETNENIWACVGVHPEEISRNNKSQITIYKELENLLNNKRVVGIGEVGLDYRQGISEEEKSIQKEVLEMQLQLAEEYTLPVQIHNRAADDEVWQLINKYNITGVMHCFTRNGEFMKKCVEKGWYISFGCFVLGKNNTRTAKVALQVPDEKLLIETDSLDAAIDVKIVARAIADIRGVSEDIIDQITSRNAHALFKKIV